MSDFESSQLAFEDAITLIAEDYKHLPDGEILITKITKKFTSLYNDPHVSELTKVVGDLSVDDARSLLFNPTISHRRYSGIDELIYYSSLWRLS